MKFMNVECFQDSELLEGKCFLHYVKAGRTLIAQGDSDSSLFFVVTGQLQVQQQVVGKENEEVSSVLFYPHTLYHFVTCVH